MDDHVHHYYSIFSYFAEQLGQPLQWWTDKRVLDFGGNWGNVLRDPKCTIKEENYSCLDVSKAGVDAGAVDFPNAHWYHYNRWNFMYNGKGIPADPLPDMGKFDVILSYSVLTVGTVNDMVTTIRNDLLPVLNPGGILMNTYVSMDSHWPLRYFLKKRGNDFSQIPKLIDAARANDFVYLVGENELIKSDELLQSMPQNTLLTFYKDAYVQKLFPECEIKPVVMQAEQHCQKCMVFTTSGR